MVEALKRELDRRESKESGDTSDDEPNANPSSTTIATKADEKNANGVAGKTKQATPPKTKTTEPVNGNGNGAKQPDNEGQIRTLVKALGFLAYATPLEELRELFYIVDAAKTVKRAEKIEGLEYLASQVEMVLAPPVVE